MNGHMPILDFVTPPQLSRGHELASQAIGAPRASPDRRNGLSPLAGRTTPPASQRDTSGWGNQ